jgi:cell division septation protein DedD
MSTPPITIEKKISAKPVVKVNKPVAVAPPVAKKPVSKAVVITQHKKPSLIKKVADRALNKRTPSPYKVIVGSFSSKENVRLLTDKLSAQKIDSCVWIYESEGKKYYRVQVGAFANYSEALNYANKLTKSGIAGYVLKK